jgi:hypothetical protein
MTIKELEEAAARRNSMALTLAGLFGCAVALFASGARTGNYPAWPWWVTAGVLLMVPILIRVFRDRPLSVQVVALVVVASTLWVTIAFTNWYRAEHGERFQPFEGFKLLAIVVALVAPARRWLAAVVILGSGAIAAIEYAAWPAEWTSRLAGQEPWVTILYAAIGFIMYLVRLRNMQLERAATRDRAEAAALERIACVLVAARHLANTPLQSIEATSALLKMKHPEAEDLTAKLDRSIKRLRRFTRILSAYEVHVNWNDREMRDAVALMESQADDVDAPDVDGEVQRARSELETKDQHV